MSQSGSNMYRIQATNTAICTMIGGPPPLPPVVPIPLPPLSPTIPIQTHPLITYRLHHSNVNSPICWNISLPPSTARLATALHGAPSWPWWREVAVRPNSLPSMTIRVQGVQRPIVVFPISLWRPSLASRTPRTSYLGPGQTMEIKRSTP
ncbi:hypothetical protein BDN70DRAFT_888751 [Pholiota conissans]|uniref:Uncharacterized protein n=1 Tax=Pholiota conissans TaxID=109636 RepID=A0A9P6CR39_9AGAR|nr:hypothetical protein BDN70DRAFT_888751 [Pholiota conissans]